MTRLLEVKDLAISFKTYGGEVQAIRGVNFHLNKGETLAIVGSQVPEKCDLPSDYEADPDAAGLL